MKSNTEFNRLKLKTDQLYLPLSGGKVNGETIFTDKVIFGSGSKSITIHNGKIEGLPEGHTYDLEPSSDKSEVTLTEDGEDKTTLPLVATFVGTRAEWNTLSATDKAKYRIVHFTDDGGSDDISEEHITFTSSDTTDANATSWTGVTTLSSGLSLKTLFSRVSQMFKNIRYLHNVLSEDVLWQGDTNYATSYTINLSDSYQNYKKLLFFLIVDTYGGRPIIREVSCEQIDYLRTTNSGSVSMCWGYSTLNDYFDIQRTSTTTSLVTASSLTKCVKVIGLKHY